jgi:hypothetical protein
MVMSVPHSSPPPHRSRQQLSSSTSFDDRFSLAQQRRNALVAGDRVAAAHALYELGVVLFVAGYRLHGARLIVDGWRELETPHHDAEMTFRVAHAYAVLGDETRAIDLVGLPANVPTASTAVRAGFSAVVHHELGHHAESLEGLRNAAIALETEPEPTGLGQRCLAVVYKTLEGLERSPLLQSPNADGSLPAPITDHLGHPDSPLVALQRVEHAVALSTHIGTPRQAAETLRIALLAAHRFGEHGSLRRLQWFAATHGLSLPDSSTPVLSPDRGAGDGMDTADDSAPSGFIPRFTAIVAAASSMLRSASSHDEPNGDEAIAMLWRALGEARTERIKLTRIADRVQLDALCRSVGESLVNLELQRGHIEGVFDASEELRNQGEVQRVFGDGRMQVATTRRLVAWAPITSETREHVPISIARPAILGTHDAWWWSTQVVGDNIVHVTCSPEERWRASIQPFTKIEEALAAFAEKIATPEDVAVHALYEDTHQRLDRLLDQCSALFPPELIGALLKERTRVIWSCEPRFHVVPIGLVKVPRGDRLLRHGLVTLAPPIATLEPSVDRARGREPTDARLVIGYDPRLEQFAPLAPLRELFPAVDDQTRSQVLTTLSFPLRLAFYYGHVDGPSQTGPLGGGLRCRDGVLSTRDLLESPTDAAPQTVVLFGCSSLSAGSTAHSEWWGPTTALLSRGTRTVIGSSVKPLIRPDTVAFARDLAEALLQFTPARALRGVQTRWLSIWEQKREVPASCFASWQLVGRW